MTFFISRGNQEYNDESISYLYDDYLKKWNNYCQNQSEKNAIEVIASYNEYYYKREELQEEVRRKMHPSFFEKFVDNLSFNQDLVHYSCNFRKELPHRTEVARLISEYGRYKYHGHKFVVDL